MYLLTYKTVSGKPKFSCFLLIGGKLQNVSPLFTVGLINSAHYVCLHKDPIISDWNESRERTVNRDGGGGRTSVKPTISTSAVIAEVTVT